MHINYLKKITAVLLIVSILLPSSLVLQRPKRAFAGVPVVEIGANLAVNTETAIAQSYLTGFTTAKEGATDSIFWIAAKMVIAALTQQIVNWINSGFRGNPAFVSDPAGFLLGLANEATGLFLEQMDLTELCDPSWLPKLKLSIQMRYSMPYVRKMRCTLEDVMENFNNYMKHFSEGGWDAWVKMTSKPQNNPYGAFLVSLDSSDLVRQAAAQTGATELNWGQGFLSLKDSNGNIITPGKVIVEQLNHALGSPLRQLEIADEMLESLSAIFNALINQLLMQGLASLSNTEDKDNWNNQGGEDMGTQKDNLRQQIEDALEKIDEETCPEIAAQLQDLLNRLDSAEDEDQITAITNEFSQILGDSDYISCIVAAGTTVAGNDTVAPSVPTNLTAKVIDDDGSEARILLEWYPSYDNVGVAGYRVYRNGVPIKKVSVTSYIDVTTEPVSGLIYTVSAYDEAGNESSQSEPAVPTRGIISP